MMTSSIVIFVAAVAAFTYSSRHIAKHGQNRRTHRMIQRLASNGELVRV